MCSLSENVSSAVRATAKLRFTGFELNPKQISWGEKIAGFTIHPPFEGHARTKD